MMTTLFSVEKRKSRIRPVPKRLRLGVIARKNRRKIHRKSKPQ